jgi:RNA polymerase sigma factor (sigma-70 family)
MPASEAVLFVIDDDASVRKAMARLLKSTGHQVEVYSSAEEFLRRPHYDGPGCLILDVQMPGLTGIELQASLAKAGYFLPIIFVSGHSDIPISVKAMKAGAVDFLTKPFQAADLLEAVRVSLKKDSEASALREESRSIQQCLQALTEREREVLRWVISGLLNKQIAYELGISEKTVKVHRARVMQKMQSDSVAELVRLVQKVGIAPASVPRATPVAPDNPA